MLGAPPLFFPNACFPTRPPHPTGGRWWTCTSKHKLRATDAHNTVYSHAGLLLGDGRAEDHIFESTSLPDAWRSILAAPTTLTTSLTETELGQHPDHPLATPLHNFWTSERRRAKPIPVEAEARLLPDPLLHLPPTPRPHTSSQPHLQPSPPPSPTPPPSPPRSPLPDLLPSRIRGTRRVRPVKCTIDRRPFTAHEVITPSGSLKFDRDKVSLHLDGTQLWSMEGAKFKQWQLSSGLDEATLATQGIEQARHSTQAEFMGARMLQWPILLALAHTFSLDTIVGPTVFDAHPYLHHVPGYRIDMLTQHSRPLILLDWIPAEHHITLIDHYADDEHAIFIARPKSLPDDSFKALEEHDSVPLAKKTAITYHQEWWHTGNKALSQSDPLTLWCVNFQDQHLSTHLGAPPIPLAPPTNTTHRLYFDHTPSGPYRARQGTHIWTDGSMIEADNVKLAGAGLVGLHPADLTPGSPLQQRTRTRNYKVGGPATNTRAELAAITSALQLADPSLPLTIYTDCMAVIAMISRWKLGEFQPRLEDEIHPDIITDTIHALHARSEADTLIVWVHAHAGDPGNEQADFEAKSGTSSDDSEWDVLTSPMTFHSNTTNTFPLLHEAKWTATVERHARKHIGALQAAFLRNHSTARSSDFVLTDGNGRETFGAVLQDRTIPEGAIRDILQARSFCFPTAAIVSRNNNHTPDTKCALCKKSTDTLGHRMMHCTEIKEAQNRMHDDIASALIQSVTLALRGSRTGHKVQVVTPHTALRIDQLWLDCPEAIADFVPNGIIIVDSPQGCKAKPRIIIVEFARCYSVELGDLEDTAAVKHMQYHSTTQFLTNKFPGHTVRCHSLIMSVFGTIPQDSWTAYFEEAGLTDAQSRRIQHDGIRACIIAGHALHNTYRSRMEILRSSCTDTSTPGHRLNRTGIG